MLHPADELHARRCVVLMANCRTILDEIDELLACPEQMGQFLLADKLMGAQMKLDFAAKVAAHGAGMVPAPVEWDHEEAAEAALREETFAETARRNAADLDGIARSAKKAARKGKRAK